jgi:hypothetical protein
MTFRTFVRMIIGLPTRQRTLDGRPMPQLSKGFSPVAVVHDRRLSVGVSSTTRKGRHAPQFRIVAWRTYTGYDKKERASVSLHRDELDPVLHLLEDCLRRLPVNFEVGSRA